MISFLDGYNVSVLAIPAYLILSFLPHVLAIIVATRGDILTWDNRNPRSNDMKAQLKQRLPAEKYATYERMESCHANGMENFPLFIAAVILGNMAGLPQDVLTALCTRFLTARLAYTSTYITTSTQMPTIGRSALWIIGVSLCVRTIVAAAGAMAAEG